MNWQISFSQHNLSFSLFNYLPLKKISARISSNFSSRAFRPTRGIVIQKFVCASVRASVRMMSQTCNRHNLRTVIGMDLLFFLMGWYKSGVVQWQTKLGLRMGKALRKIDFFRFFYKKIHNFPTKIDIDLIFFL